MFVSRCMRAARFPRVFARSFHSAVARTSPAAATATATASASVSAPASSAMDNARYKELRANGRLRFEYAPESKMGTTLSEDVLAGFQSEPKKLPPKWFYDAHGSVLFDQICDTPEYYPTRTEYALLEKAAPKIIALTNPTDIVELGSGAARKTRLLFDAVADAAKKRGETPNLRFVPYDVSGEMLAASSLDLCQDYDWLRVHGLVATFDHLHPFPPLPSTPASTATASVAGAHANVIAPSKTGAGADSGSRLVAFIGSTIGNFDAGADVEFLKRVRAQMGPRDHFLLGLDQVKPQAVLNAAYNDNAGVTAEFNRNLLSVLNRELDGDFKADQWTHVAFFNPAKSRIEMHLWCCEPHTVNLKRLKLSIPFRAGETILTEISRKFTRASTEAMLRAAGFKPTHWFPSADGYFGLSLSQPE